MALLANSQDRVAVALAFMAGVVFMLGLQDIFRRNDGHFPHDGISEKQSNEDPSQSPSPSQSPTPPPVVDGIEGCIGRTALIRVRSLSRLLGREILAKAEFLNGAGNSTKDRVALNMMVMAEAEGRLVPNRGDTIYEGTVGSTGISIAALARARGYRAHIFMPDDQAHEKSNALRALGATVERVPVQPIASPLHFVNRARDAAMAHTQRGRAAADADDAPESRGFFANQFESPYNFQAHFKTTGPEIVQQTQGRLDAFVAGAGTGGTLSGVACYLREQAEPGALIRHDHRQPSDQGSGLGPSKPRVRIVLADPQGSGLYHSVMHGVMYSTTEREGTRRRQQVDSVVEGVGVNRITHNFEVGRDYLDGAIRVTDEEAYLMARWLMEQDGIFVGSSSAVNCVAAIRTALALPPGSRVVTIFCDPGSRHLSKFWKHINEAEPPSGTILEQLGIENEGS